ncbi:MAG TPA: TolC family protein [Candidatus Acidoferrales bacterium]|nr:TolC family protein [Candidatus Acidoferrales bacterium]
MDMKSRAGTRWPLIALGVLLSLVAQRAAGQTAPAAPSAAPTRVTLDQAIDMALKHNHSLQAARTMILQNQASEITANLRPNPTISGDTQFLPLFTPGDFNSNYLDNNAQFDLGVGYLFERGKKRQHRLQAAKDQTAVSVAQTSDNERTLTFNVASQFIAVLLAQANIELADTDLKSFQQTLDIAEEQAKLGAMSGGDLLKIKLQLLQFQTDVSAAKLARIQALAGLRQLLGYDSVPENYEVVGDLEYKAVKVGKDELMAMALRQRPDVRAAQLGITAAQSQLGLAEANGKRDVNASMNYSHVGSANSISIFGSIEMPIFDRNQGEIARNRYVVTQSQELSSEQNSLALTDVENSYESLHTNDEVVQLYQSGYLKEAEDSRDISQYAYQRGAASLLDFLDAERSYRATELAYRQALASYMTSLEQLRQAVGTRSLP